MKRKILSFILIICLILPCGFMMTACKKDKQLSNAESSKVCKDVALKTWSKIGISNPISQGAGNVAYRANSSNIDNDMIEITISDKTDANAIQFNITANNMASVLYLMGMLYENTDFALTDGVVKFTATATSVATLGSMTYEFTLKPKLDTKNNKVYLEAYIVAGESGAQYVKIDADYNFDKEELNAFNVDYYTTGMWTRVSLTKEGKATIQQDAEGSKTFASEITTNKDNFLDATKNATKLEINLNATIQTYFNLTSSVLGLIKGN